MFVSFDKPNNVSKFVHIDTRHPVFKWCYLILFFSMYKNSCWLFAGCITWFADFGAAQHDHPDPVEVRHGGTNDDTWNTETKYCYNKMEKYEKQSQRLQIKVISKRFYRMTGKLIILRIKPSLNSFKLVLQFVSVFQYSDTCWSSASSHYILKTPKDGYSEGYFYNFTVLNI